MEVRGHAGERNHPISDPSFGLASSSAFLAFATNLPALVWVKDLEGRYLFVNDVAVDAFGYPREHILGRTDFELFPKEIAEQFRNNDRYAVEAGPQGLRTLETLEHRDGFVHYSEVSKFPLLGPTGEVTYIGGTAFDVTEHRLAQAKLDAVFSSIGDHLVTYDRQWRYTHVNEAAAQTLRKSKEELLGKCVWELFPEAVGNQYYRELHEALETQRVIRSEHFYEPFDKWFENHIYPREDGVTVFSSDITLRKRMEEELNGASRRKDEFLAMLGHELRNPLAPLASSLELLSQTHPDPETLRRLCAIMSRQVQQLARLIDDLVDVSRISRGRIDLKLSPMDLRQAIHHAVEATSPLFQSMQHTLEIDVPPEELPVEGDAPRLAQVFTNLLNNAARYTPPGGHVSITAHREAQTVKVSIRDSGRGIPQGRSEEIFEMFVQLERAPGEVKQGLGIGLTLVRRLVELHGGGVACYSEGQGLGSTFTVDMPLTSGVQTGRECSADSAVRVRPQRVLVVDDNVDAADSLAELMVRQGHEVQTCHDGLAALRVAEALRPEVVLLDIGLPGLNGFEAAERIRRFDWGSRTLLIAVTGWAQEIDKQRARSAGFDHHMTKPLDFVALTAILAAADRSHGP